MRLYIVDQPKSSYVQVQIVPWKMEEQKFQGPVFENYNLHEFQ